MAFYTMIGFVVVSAVVAAGVYWVVTNIKFKRKTGSKDEPDAKA